MGGANIGRAGLIAKGLSLSMVTCLHLPIESALGVERGRNCVAQENDKGWPILKRHRYLYSFVLFLHSA